MSSDLSKVSLFSLTEFPSDYFLKILDILQNHKFAKQMCTTECGWKGDVLNS